MARQTGFLRMSGTVDGVTYYRMGGIDYARGRSSLTRKRFMEDKSFEGSRRSCRRFGEGNRIAGEVYRTLKVKRNYSLYCALKRQAIRLLKEGRDATTVMVVLREMLLPGNASRPKKRRDGGKRLKARMPRVIRNSKTGLNQGRLVISHGWSRVSDVRPYAPV
jgi:hypothetical protein